MKTPTTMSREKSTGGGTTAPTGCAWRAQTTSHSREVRATTRVGSRMPLETPSSTVEKLTGVPGVQPAHAHARSSTPRERSADRQGTEPVYASVGAPSQTLPADRA